MQNLIDSIEKSRNTTLDRMFVGLGIPNVGKKTARSLASTILKNINIQNDKNNLLGAIFSITEESLLEVKDI